MIRGAALQERWIRFDSFGVPFRASVTSRDESISTSTRNEVMVITEAVVIAGELPSKLLL